MPTIVGILTFMSRINFVLSKVEHEKSFITSGPGTDPHSLLMLKHKSLFSRTKISLLILYIITGKYSNLTKETKKMDIDSKAVRA